MKTLIVYYSQDGSTRLVAERLAADLGAETLELQPEKAYPAKGLMKFAAGGFAAGVGMKPALRPYACDLKDVDRIILGSPVWNAHITPPLNTFLEEQNLSGKTVAAFACHGGGGADKLFAALEKKLGGLYAKAQFRDPAARGAETEAAYADFLAALK